MANKTLRQAIVVVAVTNFSGIIMHHILVQGAIKGKNKESRDAEACNVWRTIHQFVNSALAFEWPSMGQE